jgi:GAF domain-containing protein
MLVAHLVPGYFAAVNSQPQWKLEWNTGQRALLWAAALGSTIVPDLDVIYNAVFHGFVNHSTLWTHSLFVHLTVALGWWLLRRIGRWPYLQTLVGLVAVGGLSHLVLDVSSHGTPLLYPVSLVMFGFPPERVVEGGFWAYLTDPIFLLEPLLLTLAAAHWTLSRKPTQRVRPLTLIVLTGVLVLFTVAFLLLLPVLQSVAAS